MLKSMLGKGLAMLLSTVMITGTVWVSDAGYVKAEPVPCDISLNVNAGGEYGDGAVQIKIGDEDWSDFTETISKSSILSGSETSKDISVKAEPDSVSEIAAAELRCPDGETAPVDIKSSIAGDEGYTFSYDGSKPYEVFVEFSKKPAGSSLPEDKFIYDEESNMYVLTVTDENKEEIASYNDIRILSTHKLVIATDFIISGELAIDGLAAITVNKGCSVTAGSVSIANIATVTLGDKNCLSGLGIAADKLKEKRTGDSTLYSFEANSIDNTEFMKEGDNYVYKAGNDCGINLNSNGTCKDGSTQYGDVAYSVYTNASDTEAAYTGTLSEDWASVDFDPSKFKAGSRIDFVVKSYNGKVLQSSGVRFPDNKTYISSPDEEAKAGTVGCQCSYTLTENPDKYLSVVVDFVDSSEVMTTADFAWSYDTRVQEVDFDKYVSHGTIEVISANKEGELTNTNDPEAAPFWSVGTASIHMSDPEEHEWDEMQAKFEPGTTVVVRLIPDRGYQLTRFTISGIENTTTARDGVNEYTFNLTRPGFYNLCAVFTEVGDEVDSSGAAGVTGGNVTFASGEVDKGTVALTVNDTTASPSERARFEAMAASGGYSVSQTLNIGAEQRFYKGVENAGRDQCWVQEISQELSAEASIELNVSGIAGNEVSVLHNHNGRYEEIPATYSNGVVSFRTQSFSNFAIVSKGANKESSNSSSSSDKEEEAAPAVSKPTTLGTVSGGTSIKNWSDLDKLLAAKSLATAKTTSEKAAIKAPVILALNGSNATLPASTVQALQNSDATGLHLIMGNGAAVTISNGAALKNQGAINLSNRVTQTNNSKTIAFASNAKLLTLSALHMSVPKNVKEAKLYIIVNGQPTFLGKFTPVDGRVFFPITQLGTYQLLY